MADTFFKQNLKYIREAHNKSQVEMAKSLEIPLKTYQSYEEGRATPNPSKIIDICCTLNLTFENLFKANMALTLTHTDILRKYVKN